MKKLLLASVLAIASLPGFAADQPFVEDDSGEGVPDACFNSDGSRVKTPECLAAPGRPPARVTVQPPYQGPSPIGWVYAPYTQCGDPPRCSMGVVSVAADGLNVRVTPNGPAVVALVNGVPLIPVTRQGPWILVAAGCDLTPTFAWSWTAGVPLNRCWVYF
jgi:hypothetical protein